MKATDAFYAAIGAPVLAGRKALELGSKAMTTVKDGVEASAAEGRTLADKFGENNVVEELSTRLDVDERVGKLRDQVETVVERWKENFQADDTKKAEAKKPAAKKPAAKKATAKKETTKKPAAKAKKSETPAEKVDVTS